MMIKATTNDQELQFPVDWNYKIITVKKSPDFINAIGAVLANFGITEQPVAGQRSSNGKYLTYKLTVTFHNREEMEKLSEAISALPDVKFIL